MLIPRKRDSRTHKKLDPFALDTEHLALAYLHPLHPIALPNCVHDLLPLHYLPEHCVLPIQV